MGDAIFIIRHEAEALDHFNERLSQICSATTVTAIDVHKGSTFLGVSLIADVEQDEETKEVVPAGPRMSVWFMELDADEGVKAFNKRLEDACTKMDVTSAELRIVQNRPVLALFTETEPDPDEKNNEEIPISDIVQVRICRISALDPKQAATTEGYMEKIFEQARGAVTDIQFESDGDLLDFAMVVFADMPEADDKDDPIDAEEPVPTKTGSPT